MNIHAEWEHRKRTRDFFAAEADALDAAGEPEYADIYRKAVPAYQKLCDTLRLQIIGAK